MVQSRGVLCRLLAAPLRTACVDLRVRAPQSDVDRKATALVSTFRCGVVWVKLWVRGWETAAHDGLCYSPEIECSGEVAWPVRRHPYVVSMCGCGARHHPLVPLLVSLPVCALQCFGCIFSGNAPLNCLTRLTRTLKSLIMGPA